MSTSAHVSTAPRAPSRARRPIVVAMIASGLPSAGRVAEIFERHGVHATVRCVSSPETVRDTLDREPDVVLLAHRRGAAGAMRRIQRIRRHFARAAIVTTVSQGDEQAARCFVAAGVDGLLEEGELETCLALVVNAVCAGYVALPQRLRYLIEPPALSHREKQILALVIAGRTNAEIADRLCLGESTVKTHLSSAFRRLGVSSRRDAAAVVLNRDPRLRAGVLMTMRDPAQNGRRRKV
jgi:DNA-binding NarL/FixJ family response regulator